jgi:hypothetical protein
MDDLDDIKARVAQMPPEKEAELRTWLLERDHNMWDEQIAGDQKSGKLDKLLAQAKADRDAGHGRDL